MSSQDKSDSEGSDSEDGYDDYYNEAGQLDDELVDECEFSIHPMLQRDIELFKQLCSSENIECRRLDELQEIDVTVKVDTAWIEPNVLNAWGLLKGLPLLVKLKLCSVLYYQNANQPTIELYQEESQKPNGVLIQLKKIVETFCHQQFKSLAKYDIENLSLRDEEEVIDDANDSNSRDDGFMVKLRSYMQRRLESLNDYCPICDKSHGKTSMLKPAVCSKPLCVFSSQTLGVMCRVSDTLYAQPEVLDLLINITNVAVASSRRDKVLKPFPAVMDSNTQDYVFTEDEQGYIKLRKVMNIVSMAKISPSLSESELKKMLDAHHEHCYPLLRWIVSSNRSHILHIPKEKQLELMGASHQFILRNSPPAEDAHFRQKAKEFGSYFAFHGSPIENWHSIIRQGLVVASGTELQLHGAALGNGIYVTTRLSTALGYAGQQCMKRAATLNADTRSLDNQVCIALCEVIAGPRWDVHHAHQPEIIRVSDSRELCTRFFFLYATSSNILHRNLDRAVSTSDEFMESIKAILSEI